jgi:Lrp/AsnC family transcriptional regulator for asnA, asnC and gidA
VSSTDEVVTPIDELDAGIITLLRANGRRSNVEIARQLRVAEGTVRKRIERLVRKGVIQIGAWADPHKIGYQVYINMDIQARLPNLEEIANRLTRLSEIFFLGLCTGRSGIFAGCCFRSNKHFHEFMTKRLARIEGIESISTTIITQILKREHTFPVLPVNGRNTSKSDERKRAARRTHKDRAGVEQTGRGQL